MDVDFTSNLLDVESVEFVPVVHFESDRQAGNGAGALDNGAESTFTEDTYYFEILY